MTLRLCLDVVLTYNECAVSDDRLSKYFLFSHLLQLGKKLLELAYVKNKYVKIRKI